MSNSKGNAYPLWLISNNAQIQSVDTSQKISNQSKENFAMGLGISEDGTVWALSTEPDPDGGGAKIYWSNGDENWNEIASSDPGGVKICGYTGSSCLFLTGSGDLLSMDTNGSSNKLVDGSTTLIYDFDYGNSVIWAILAKKSGMIPSLHYTNTNAPLSWKEVGDQVYDLYSLSVNYAGNCYGAQDYKPVYYDTNGSTGSAGSTGQLLALQVSFKNANFMVSNDGTAEGNLVYEWVDEQGGTYSSMNIRAMTIQSTYYSS